MGRTLTNDMMPVGIPARDLTPGDMVSADELLTATGERYRSPDLLCVTAVHDASSPDCVIVETETGIGWRVAGHLELTVRPLVCDDCGDDPDACECGDGETIVRGVE